MSVITLAPYGQLPAVQLTAADGARAIVTLYGAHLVSWQSADRQGAPVLQHPIGARRQPRDSRRRAGDLPPV